MVNDLEYQADTEHVNCVKDAKFDIRVIKTQSGNFHKVVMNTPAKTQTVLGVFGKQLLVSCSQIKHIIENILAPDVDIFNIITRVMILIAHGANPIKDGGGYNWDVIIFNLVAIGLSTLILYRFDVPEIELAFNR